MSTEPILKFGVPKGSLEEATQDLFARAGWKISRHERNYFPDVNDPELQLSLTRVQEIGGLVADGILDAGIAARDWIREMDLEDKPEHQQRTLTTVNRKHSRLYTLQSNR